MDYEGIRNKPVKDLYLIYSEMHAESSFLSIVIVGVLV